MALKDTAVGMLSKKGEHNDPINIDHLSELLQHQMNKINLVVLSSNNIQKDNLSLASIADLGPENEGIISDQIIRYVDCIRDIVLEMKRRITFDHIRCILKGKDIKEQGSSPLLSLSGQGKKGILEFAIKHTDN
jgi:hypothetical protein